MSPKKLSLEPDKTEACFLGGGGKWKKASFRVLGCLIRPSPSIKYLGIWLDKRLSFRNHVIKACEKALKVHRSLIPLLPNIRGPSFKKRKLILNAVYSSLFYGVPLWADVTKISKYCAIITKTCRPLKRSICAAYRTVSNNILDILSGIPPTDLYVESRCRQFSGEPKPQVRADIIERWASRLDSEPESDIWFKSLIPDLRGFLHRPFGDTNFYMTQFFSGHGSFCDYLFRFKILNSNLCPLPGCNSPDSPEHTFFHCPFFSTDRILLEAKLGSNFTLFNTQDLLLSSQENWNCISSFVEQVIRCKNNHMSQTPPADGIHRCNSGATLTQGVT